MAFTFTINVSEVSWNTDLGGWVCPVLKIPSSKIEAIYVEGEKLDDKKYQVLNDHNAIRWTSEKSQPNSFTVSVVIEKELSTKELTLKWKKLAIFMPLICSLLSLLAGIYIPKNF